MDLKEELKAGDEITIQIAPFGEYPAETVGGVEIVEVFTKEAFEKIIDNWKADGSKMIRADFDHKSEMTDDTVASGWIKDLYVDDDKGLMGTLVVSEKGAEALNGLDYRYGSPVFILEGEDDQSTPTHLISYAFTNRPRLRDMDAVWNSETKNVIKNDNTVNDVNEEKDTDEVNNEESDIKDNNMEFLNKIREVLGLPAEAVEEDVIKSVQEMVDAIKAKEEESLKAEAEEMVNELPIEEEKKEEVIANFISNPDFTRKILKSIKMEAKTVVNTSDASKPELKTALMDECRKLKGGQERVDFLMAHKGQF